MRLAPRAARTTPGIERRARPKSASAPPPMADAQRSASPTFCRVSMDVMRRKPASGVPRSAEARQIEAALGREERGPESAAAFQPRRDVVETEVVDGDAVF